MKRIHDYKKIAYEKYLSYAVKNETLFSVIECLHGKYTVALVTTASRKNTEDILMAFGVLEQFDFILTQEDVSETKPSLECFMLAMKKAGSTPENTIIFEDSDTGLKAAELSGAKYVKVYGYN